jgi:multidrug efflux system outer membrane protein
MRIAVIRVEEARAAFGVASADRLPTVNLNASNAVTVTPATIFGPDGKEIVSKRFDLTNTMVSYEIDLWGRLASLSEASRASLLSTDATRRSVRISLIAAVANTYYSMQEAETSLSLAKATVLNREMALEIIQQAFERGAVSQLEVLQAESVLEAAKSAVSLIEGQRASSENLMVSLVGRMPDDLPVGKGLNQSLDSSFMTGLPSEVLLARPDIVAVEQRLVAANANVAAARTAFLPKLLLTAGFGLASKSLASLFSAGSQAWNYTPSVSLPIFDGGRTESSFDLAQARQNIAVVEYERAIQQAFREVSDLLAQRASTMEQARSAEANLKVQDGRLLVMQARHKAGAATYMEVLDVLRDQFAAQRQVVQIRRGELSTAAQLFKALGGGDV